MTRVATPLAIALLAVSLSACMRVHRPALQPTPSAPGTSLWERPTDIASRDLYYGPWGAERAPAAGATYTLVERKHTGVNVGMTVVDERGREWSVKQPYPGGLDSEAGVEVVVSRLLSAIGYHQPAAYYLPSFTLKDDWGTHIEVGGRFRLKEETLKDTGEWSWQENPFVGSQPYQGLLALLMMFNSTDLKNQNNTLYERRRGDLVEQWYVVRDVGAALGDTNRLAPFKGHPQAFARTPYILGVSNGHVDFAYRGWYDKLVRDRISPEDVAWAANLLGQLSDAQLRDAFRAGGFDSEATSQFIRALRSKIDEGRNVGRRAANSADSRN
jgi:hypothetical protein